MKKRYIIVFFILTLVLELTLSIVFLSKNSKIENDTVKINELVKEIENNYNDTTKYPTSFEYVLIDNNGKVLYKNGNDVQETLNQAIRNGDTIVDIVLDNSVVGKVIIKNTFIEQANKIKNEFVISIIVISLVQLASFGLYFYYLYRSVIKPFDDMRDFAERVAGGNLDIPLKMDKGNNFGAFTESFDIMRSELKKAKIAEREAEQSKRELVARLSHDIKTPVASIMSVSELGIALSKDDKEKSRLTTINQKADQINTLVNNLFTVTIEELDELAVNPINIPSYVVKELISNSDYLNKGSRFTIPEATVFFDRLRLQQVFDNIFANSYKYANTNIDISSEIKDDYLVVSIKDYGDSINDSDMPLLMEKYNRGNNTLDKEGAGLGLYISKKFMDSMNGNIEIYNDKPGFRVLVYLRII